MANILKNFDICDRIPKNLLNSIKLFHIFNYDNDEKNIIFATNEDKVYGLGSNESGCLGFGHCNEVKECTEIKELSNHKISEIFVTVNHSLAITDENTLFVWESNLSKYLIDRCINEISHSSKTNDLEFFKPSEIKFPNNEMIEDIKCGDYHTLVLLSNGLLYGWVCYPFKQLGFRNSTPKRLTINGNELRFNYIYCFGGTSFAVTTNGELFSWDWNRYTMNGHEMDGKCDANRIDLMNVHKICSFPENTYFLTNEGLIYFCGIYEDKVFGGEQNTSRPKKMEGPEILIKDIPQFTGDIAEDVTGICVDSEKSFYSLNYGKLVKLNENYESIIDLYAIRFEITPQTVHISSEKPEKYFILQSGVKIYPCGEGIEPDQTSNDFVGYNHAKQDTPTNSIAQSNENQLKFEKIESKVNKLSQDLENETIRNNYLSKSLMKANEEIRELKLQMKTDCNEGYKDLNYRPK